MAKKKKVLKAVSKKKTQFVQTPNRKDFEVFARGVERLEELRTELNKLNTSGYDKEVNSIKSKLKNVSYIPEIEKELRVLKQKINGAYKEKPNNHYLHLKVSRKINELKDRIPKEHAKIRRKIEELGEHVQNKNKINKKIKELEKEIDKKLAKKQLSGNEIKLVKDIPKIQNQLNSFKRFLRKQSEEEKRRKEILRHIDPDVSFLINDKFNLSLNEIKEELSKRLQNKELDIQKQLQRDLENRKKNFDLMYKDLEKRFERKYHEKVNSSLKKDLKEKFNNVVAKKVRELRMRVVEEEKKKIREQYNEQVDMYKENLDNKMNSQLTKEVKKLHAIFNAKKKEEEKRINKLNKDFQKRENLKRKRIEGEKKKFVERLKKEKDVEVKKLVVAKSALIMDKLKKEFNNKLKLEIKSKEAEFEKRKADLALEVQKKAKQLFV